VGEIYSTAWDCFTAAAGEASSQIDDSLLDVIVYPQSLPNAAPGTLHIYSYKYKARK